MQLALVSVSSRSTALKYLKVIPSPHPAEAEADRRSLNVVTRAQSRKNAVVAPNVDECKAVQK